MQCFGSHNGRGVNGEDAPLFSYLALTTVTVTMTTQTTQTYWSPYEIELHLCLGNTVCSV